MNSFISKPANWLGVMLAALIPLIVAAVSYGVLSANVNHNSAMLDLKQDLAVANARYEMMSERLRRIEDKADLILLGIQKP